MGRVGRRVVLLVAAGGLVAGLGGMAASGAAAAVPATGRASAALTSSSSPSFNELYGVSAVSGSNAWAVGRQNSTGVFKTLILHWNGAAWSTVKSPSPSSSDAELFGVSTRSGSDAWAVGNYDSNTLIVHWNGTAWTQVKTPSLGPGVYGGLNGVSAVSGSDAWAVGSHSIPSDPGRSRTLVLHWNGTAWSKINSPTPNPNDLNFLEGVSARSGSDAWAAGRYWNTTGVARSLILHWNGTAWSKINSPNPSP